jgi:hypothetical protein
MISLPPAPLKMWVSKPKPPSTTSEASPGSQTKVSLPVPRNAVSAPRCRRRSRCAASEEDLAAAAADEGVVALLAEDQRLLGGGEGAVEGVEQHAIVAATSHHVDGAERGEIEGRVGRAVVPGVDLELVPIGRAHAQRDLVRERGA